MGDVALININALCDIGVVNVNVNGTNYTVNIISGKGVLELKDFKEGTYTINVTYIENEKYLASTNGTVLEVSRSESSIYVGVDNITVGDNAIINIAVSDGASGNVTIKIGNEFVKTVGVTSGVISVVASGLSVGGKTVNVIYNGDDKFKSNSNSTEFNVGKTTANINLVVSDIVAFEKENIIVFINSSGNVTIKLDGTVINTVDIVDDKVEYSIDVTDIGKHCVEVIYNGNANVNSTSAKANFTVLKNDFNLSVEVSDIVYGGVEYIIIKSDVEGKVNVTVNGITKEYSLNTTIALHNLAAGKYLVEVTLISNENIGKTVTAEFNVFKLNTTLDIEVKPSINVGNSQLINITVDNVNATGEVTIMIDDINYTATLTDGKANFTISSLIAGKHTVTVIYDGNENLTGSWNSAIFEVVKLSTSINVTSHNVDCGNEEVITILNLPDKSTGFVIINVDEINYIIDINETKELHIIISKSGTHNVVATYLGDDKYDSSNATTTFNASKVSGDVNFEISNTVGGGDIVVKANLPNDARGYIKIIIDNETKVVPVKGGQNNINVSNVGQGTHNITISYSGDDKYDSKIVIENITVISSINVDENIIMAINSPFDYEVEFLDKDGHILKNTEVLFVVNGKNYTAVTDGKGIARLTNAHLGVTKVTNNLKIKQILKVKKKVKVKKRKKIVLKAKLKWSKRNPIKGKKIVFKFKGKKYKAKTNKKGIAKIKIKKKIVKKLKRGKKYKYSAKYLTNKVKGKVKIKFKK